MSEYAKTPWRVHHPHAGARGWEVADSSGLNQVCQEVTEANARRIVACVNACEGLDTGDLESTGLVSAICAAKLGPTVRVPAELVEGE